MAKFSQKDFDIPQVALDLGFEDQSFRGDPFAYMVNEPLRLGLLVATGEYEVATKRFTVVKVDDSAQFYGPDDVVYETDSDFDLSGFIDSRKSSKEYREREFAQPATVEYRVFRDSDNFGVLSLPSKPDSVIVTVSRPNAAGTRLVTVEASRTVEFETEMDHANIRFERSAVEVAR